MAKFDKKPTASHGSGKAAPRGQDLTGNAEFSKIAPWLAQVKFQKKAVGGLDPVDVWKKIEELNAMYERAMVAERARYDLLLKISRSRASQGDGSDG